MQHTKLSIQDMVTVGLCTAIIAILAQIVIPLPSGVPMTMQSFAITLVAMILGSKKGALAALLYVLTGAIGLPVFTSFRGGFQCLLDPTGGFLLTFPLMAYFIGLGTDKKQRFPFLFYLFLTLGTILNYVGGLLIFCFSTNSTLAAGFVAAVAPFIPTAIIKAVLAVWSGNLLRKRLNSVFTI